MTEHIIAIVLAVIGSTGLFTFIQFLIKRHDEKKGTLAKVERWVESLKRDSTRTQLLLLISDYPENIQEILKVAERYFVELDGNWYMSTVFSKWLAEQELPRPDWYKH